MDFPDKCGANVFEGFLDFRKWKISIDMTKFVAETFFFLRFWRNFYFFYVFHETFYFSLRFWRNFFFKDFWQKVFFFWQNFIWQTSFAQVPEKLIAIVIIIMQIPLVIKLLILVWFDPSFLSNKSTFQDYSNALTICRYSCNNGKVNICDNVQCDKSCVNTEIVWQSGQ